MQLLTKLHDRGHTKRYFRPLLQSGLVLQSHRRVSTHSLCVFLCMLKPAVTKKRKRSGLAAESGRTVAGSAFAACPICAKQVTPAYFSC